MRMSLFRQGLCFVAGLLFIGTALIANGTRLPCSDRITFSPLSHPPAA